MEENGAFWKSRKFWYTVIAAVLFAVLAITRTVEFTSTQVMEIILALLGISVGAHTATDIASLLAKKRTVEVQPTPASSAAAEDAIRAVKDAVIEEKVTRRELGVD